MHVYNDMYAPFQKFGGGVGSIIIIHKKLIQVFVIVCDKWSCAFSVKKISEHTKNEKVSLPGIEPGTLSVLDSRDNHYTTETTGSVLWKMLILTDT